MAGRLKNAAAWLGLVTDDRYEDDRYNDNELTANVDVRDQQSANVHELERRRGSQPVMNTEERSDRVEPVEPAPRTADVSRIITVHPRTYNEARTIGEHFRDGVPVIMNLSDMEDADAKRLVDFSAGLIFGLHGTIERVTSKVFLLSPQNVNVTAEDKERIAGGFFNQS